MDNSMIYIVIGLLLSSFTSRTYDFINEYNNIKNISCDEKRENGRSLYNTSDNNEYYKCIDNRTNKLDEYDKTKMLYMLLIGFVFIVIGFTMSRFENKYNNSIKIHDISSNGISFGGVLLIIWFVITNWRKLSDAHQLFAIGSVLAGLLATPYYFK